MQAGTVSRLRLCVRTQNLLQVEHYHLTENDYSFDALQAYCFGINIKL